MPLQKTKRNLPYDMYHIYIATPKIVNFDQRAENLYIVVQRKEYFLQWISFHSDVSTAMQTLHRPIEISERIKKLDVLRDIIYSSRMISSNCI